MSLTATCNSCGRQYQAPEAMAGRRVRCKACGNTFDIPRVDGEEVDQLAELEKTFGSTGLNEVQSDEGDVPRDESEYEGDEDRGEAPAGRKNLPLRYSGSGQVDSFLPPALLLIGLGWLFADAWTNNSSGVGWLALVRFAILLAGYSLIVAPLTNMMIAKAAESLGYQLPYSAKWRGYTSYLLAMTLAIFFWNVGDGAVIALILGAFLGVAISTAFLWLLFRLRPSEIMPSGGYAAAGFCIGLAITSGLGYGLNLLLINVMVQTKKADLFAASPFGENMAWLSDEQKSDIVKVSSPPKKTTSPDSTSTTKSTPVVQAPIKPPVAPPNASSIVINQEAAPIPPGFDQIVRPLTDSDFLLAVRHSGSTDNLELWNDNTWTQRGSATFANVASNNERYVLSGDGDHLARIATFPRLSIQIWSFTDNRVIDTRELDDKSGTPQLIGFVGENKLLIRWHADGGDSIAIADTSSASKPIKFDTVPFELGNNTLAISSDGTLAAMTAKIDGVPMLAVYDLNKGALINQTQKIKSIDPQWAIEPSGFSITADGRKLALMFEQNGAAIIINFAIDAKRENVFYVNEQVYPAGPTEGADTHNFSGNKLAWMPGGKSWLVYGAKIYDPTSGRKMDELGVTNVMGAKIVEPDIVELDINGSNNQRQLLQLHVNNAKLQQELGK